MICSLSLFKNIKEGGKGTRMIPLSIYHHELKFIINLVNLIFFGGGGLKELILREQERRKTGKQQITGRLLVFSVSAGDLNVEAGREWKREQRNYAATKNSKK